jgi:hypothetical protein
MTFVRQMDTVPHEASVQAHAILSTGTVSKCLATDTYPHMIPLSPSEALLALRKSIYDLTGRPARDYNYLTRSAR